MSTRHKPTAAFWITLGLILLFVVYPLSIGPAFYVVLKAGQPAWLNDAFHVVYGPVFRLVELAPACVDRLAFGYLFWWARAAGVEV
ncbi:MAG: hypothetical protein EXS05_17190 [Planctomycetaceae bacterium]|nr:hypothetical protein [Planctomycetaceae bacterium]